MVKYHRNSHIVAVNGLHIAPIFFLTWKDSKYIHCDPRHPLAFQLHDDIDDDYNDDNGYDG